MNMQVLEYFLTVAQEGNITRSAGLLHITQPTLSRQLKDLETELGKKLLKRTNKSVSLTQDGMVFRETAREILTLYRKAKSENNWKENLSGDIYIGAGETESFRILAKFIQEFHRLHPLVCFHILSETAERIGEDVDKGVLDFGFIMRSVAMEKYDFWAFSHKELWGVLVRKDHPLASKKFVTPQELINEPLILPENTIFRQELLQWLNDRASIFATYSLVYNALRLLQEGPGVIVCLKDPAFTDTGYVFLPLLPEQTVSPLLIWKKKLARSSAVECFLQFICHTKNESPLL